MSRHLHVLIFIGFVYPLKCITIDLDYITFVSELCALVISVGRSYEFPSEMMIQCLTYCTYAQMDV